MRVLLAILITAVLLAATYMVSVAISFDVEWILILITALWAAMDSAKIELNRYKFLFACPPVVLFCLCLFLWIVIFPWYLWARMCIRSGSATLKEEPGLFKKFLRWTAGIAVVGLAATIIGVVIFCFEETHRGTRVWGNYQHELEARGATLKWDDLIPPPVPDAQNIFAAPKMSEWFIKPSGKMVMRDDLAQRMSFTNNRPREVVAMITIVPRTARIESDTNKTVLRLSEASAHWQAIEAIQRQLGPNVLGAQGTFMIVERPAIAGKITPARILIEADQTPPVKDLYLLLGDNSRGPGPLNIKSTGSNTFQVTASVCPAADYLKWSDQFAADFDLMREGLKRPCARMEGNYDSPLAVPLPDYRTFRVVSQAVAQRAQCHLLMREPEKAFRELSLVHGMRRMLEASPTGKPMTLVAAMVNVAETGIYAQVIADGLRLCAWQEPQLLALQEQLETIQLTPQVVAALRAEQAFNWRMTQVLVNCKSKTAPSPDSPVWRNFKDVRPPKIIAGFVDLNIYNATRLDQMVIESMDTTQRVVFPRKLADFVSEDDKLCRHMTPYNLLAAVMVPNFTRAVQTCAYMQTKVDEAQVACALERYRLANGKYPESLDALTPKLIEKLPHDIVGGQPLKYHATTGGQFALYSVGWNEKDDGGHPSSSPYDKDDWVWE